MDGVKIYRPTIPKENLSIAMMGSDLNQKPARIIKINFKKIGPPTKDSLFSYIKFKAFLTN